MSSLLLPHRFYSQPQGGVEVNHQNAVFVLNPVFDNSSTIFNWSKKNVAQPTVTASTGNVKSVHRNGHHIRIDLRGGAYGIGSVTVNGFTQQSVENGFTVVSGIIVRDVSLTAILSDSSGPNAWGFTGYSGTSLSGFHTDAGVNTATATITGLPTLAVGMEKRCAYRKAGVKSSVFDHETRKYAEASSSGLGIYSSSGTLFRLGPSSFLTDVNFLYIFDAALTDNEIWSLLDNPWQIFKASE